MAYDEMVQAIAGTYGDIPITAERLWRSRVSTLYDAREGCAAYSVMILRTHEQDWKSQYCPHCDCLHLFTLVARIISQAFERYHAQW